MARQGVLVQPYTRLSLDQVERIHQSSLAILTDPGILCYNREAAYVFGDHGSEVHRVETSAAECWLLKIPERAISEAVDAAPRVVKLGTRDEDNCLILDGREPRIHFASGAEANNWLDVDADVFVSKRDPRVEVELPMFRVERGNLERLALAARLCEGLDNWDGFLRPVNIQDDDVNDDNKDVNKFFVSLNNTTKHVMSGLTELSQLDNVLKMAQIIAGGEEEFRAKSHHLHDHLHCKEPPAARGRYDTEGDGDSQKRYTPGHFQFSAGWFHCPYSRGWHGGPDKRGDSSGHHPGTVG